MELYISCRTTITKMMTTNTPITVHSHGGTAVTSYRAIAAIQRFLEFQGPGITGLIPRNRRKSPSEPELLGTSRSISGILSRPLPAGAIIHLGPLLPAASCDLPGDSGEQPSCASADAYASF